MINMVTNISLQPYLEWEQNGSPLQKQTHVMFYKKNAFLKIRSQKMRSQN